MHIHRQSPLASWSRVQVEEILYSSDVENLKEKKFSWPLYFLSEYDTSEIQFITYVSSVFPPCIWVYLQPSCHGFPSEEEWD